MKRHTAPDSYTMHGMAPHRTAQHSTGGHSTARQGTHGTAQHSTAQQSTANHCPRVNNSVCAKHTSWEEGSLTDLLTVTQLLTSMLQLLTPSRACFSHPLTHLCFEASLLNKVLKRVQIHRRLVSQRVEQIVALLGCLERGRKGKERKTNANRGRDAR